MSILNRPFEYYPKRQGRPTTPGNRSLESGKSTTGYILAPHIDDDDPHPDYILEEEIDEVLEDTENISRTQNLLIGFMNAFGEDDFDWEDFDTDDMDEEDITDLVEEKLDTYLEKAGGTLTGQLMLSGKGIAWEDLRTPITAVKLSGTKPPTWTSYKGTEVLAFSDQALVGNEEIVYFSMQMPHNYKQGTNITIHVHYTPEDNTGGNVYWMLTYSWSNINSAFATESTLYLAGECGTITDTHRLVDFAELDGSPNGVDKGISSMLLCKLQRHSSNILDTYNSKSVYLLEVDAHYQIDSLGSSSISKK